MKKEQVLVVVQEAIKKNTDKSELGLAYEQGFEDGANYALQKLEQCTCSTLREQLIQMNNNEVKIAEDDTIDEGSKNVALSRISSITHVLMMIDGELPVAYNEQGFVKGWI